MGSSVIIRRWISRGGSAGLLRSCSRRGSAGVLSGKISAGIFLPLCNPSSADRMMTTASGGKLPSVPWLMLPPAADGSGNMCYKFQSLATSEPVQFPVDIINDDVKFVGSSHGWLAFYNRRNINDLFLSNPITDRHIKLPPLHNVPPPLHDAKRVILSSSPDENEIEGNSCLAFMTFGAEKRLALCSPLSSNEWTLFGGGNKKCHVYENLVYSSRQKRLFCITWEEEITSLEGWDVGDTHQTTPKLDWVIQRSKELDFDNPSYEWPSQHLGGLKDMCFLVKYLVCADHSGELFLVVRHVNLLAGPHGSLVDKIVFSLHRGRQFNTTPYKTIGFEVFKIDQERGEVKFMEDSLDGLSMFVGINQPFAVPASEVPGLKPDSVYFTDENCLIEPTRMAWTNYGGHDNGIFDYQQKDFSPCCSFYPIDYQKIRRILPPPLWFTPNRP